MIAKTLLSSIAIMLIAFANADYDVAKYCKLVIPGTKLPSLKSCKTYYTCPDSGEPTQADCAGTTVFSKNSQNCVPKTNSNCYYGLSNPCEFKDKEFAPSDKGCNMWNYCANGKIMATASCPFGQIFYALNSSCINGNCPTDSDEAGKDVENICEIMPDGVFFGDFKDCSTWHKCNAMTKKSGSCSNDLMFDTKSGMCLQNDGDMCQRTNNVVVSQASGPPSQACTNISQIVGDTNICSIYYTCKVNSQTPNRTYEWSQNKCDNKYFDVISKQCNNTSLARPYPGCDRCQFTTGNPYWTNAVDANCSKYFTCNHGKKVGATQGSCGKGNFFNQDSQACIVEGNESQYGKYNGACQDYSCTDDRICSLIENNTGTGSSDVGGTGTGSSDGGSTGGSTDADSGSVTANST